jgi:hypothetical protein
MDPQTLLSSRAVFSRREPGDDWWGQRRARQRSFGVNMASYLGGAPWSALYLRIARDWVCLGSLGWGALRSVIWADGLCEHYDDCIERALAL